MSRSLLFIPLLLATGVVLADDVPEAARVAGAIEKQAQDDVPDAESEADAEEAKARDDLPDAENVEGAAETQAQTKEGAKVISGMSILGNQEAPKSLVIVPWKSSVLGDSLGISTMLDDSKQPIDKEVFMRALSYYEIRSETRP
jgi:Sec-independent protein translocase protein TatA